MQTKRLTLESFKTLVKRIIKEEMNQNDDKKFKREMVKDLNGEPINLIVKYRDGTEKKISGTVNDINNFEGGFSPSGFWLNPQQKGMYVMYDKDFNKWIDGNTTGSMEIRGATANDTYILNRIKETIPEFSALWNQKNLIQKYSDMPRLEESKKRKLRK